MSDKVIFKKDFVFMMPHFDPAPSSKANRSILAVANAFIVRVHAPEDCQQGHFEMAQGPLGKEVIFDIVLQIRWRLLESQTITL